jgi:phosphatidylglycerophosphatase A
MMIRPNTRFLLAHPAHFIALGLGTGMAPVAPGTVGTLLAYPIYHLMVISQIGTAAVIALIAVFFLIGVWACAVTGRAMGIADHSSMVWDEVVAMLLILLLIPPETGWWIAAFFVFRFFDVVKPPPIRHFDRTLKGGFGVMFDDILAAFYTLLVLAVAHRILN